MILIGLLLASVFVGMWAGFKAEEAWLRFQARRRWDADTGEALAITNEAADRDDEFDVWMQQRWADR